MKWLGSFLVVALLAVSSTAQAAPITFVGTFSGGNESPAVPTLGTGLAVVEFDPAAHTLFVDVEFSGLTGTTTVSHIHCCAAPGTNAGVATMTPTFIGFPAGVTFGTYSNTFDLTQASSFNAAFITANGGSVAQAEAALLAGMLAGNAYFNIHTTFRPGGEIRANLSLVPEPGTLVLFGTGLVAAVVARRRSTRRDHAA